MIAREAGGSSLLKVLFEACVTFITKFIGTFEKDERRKLYLDILVIILLIIVGYFIYTHITTVGPCRGEVTPELSPSETSEPPEQKTYAGFSEKEVRSFIEQAGIHQPEKSEYLTDFRVTFVKAPSGHSVNAYNSHRTDKKHIGYVLHGEKVVVAAENENNGFSCVVIVESLEAVWINSQYCKDAAAKSSS